MHTNEFEDTAAVEHTGAASLNRRSLIGGGAAAGLAAFLAGPLATHAAAGSKSASETTGSLKPHATMPSQYSISGFTFNAKP